MEFNVLKCLSEQFQFKGIFLNANLYGSGHINDTYAAIFQLEAGNTIRYILQRINNQIFRKPEQLMENISGVTSYLRDVIIENGGDPERETLNIVPTKSNHSFYKDSEGRYWRAYLFIEDALSYDQVESAEDFYQSGLAFGNFQRLLADYPAHTLHETIKDFHNTKKRLQRFKEVVKADVRNRVKDVAKEIAFIMDREADACVLTDMLEKGELPLRVTHNDTKLNNVMIDNATRKGICVVDLDTVMPGLAINDFGDSIRFGANTAKEDETDLTKVSCNLPLFETYVDAFLTGCGGSLTLNELDMLAMGAKVMTYECGMRFLTDYLEGDVYFKIQHDNHNLDRARTQLALVKDMEQKWDTMLEIVNKYH